MALQKGVESYHRDSHAISFSLWEFGPANMGVLKDDHLIYYPENWAVSGWYVK